MLKGLSLGGERARQDTDMAHVHLVLTPADSRSATGEVTVPAEVAEPGGSDPDGGPPSDGGA